MVVRRRYGPVATTAKTVRITDATAENDPYQYDNDGLLDGHGIRPPHGPHNEQQYDKNDGGQIGQALVSRAGHLTELFPHTDEEQCKYLAQNSGEKECVAGDHIGPTTAF